MSDERTAAAGEPLPEVDPADYAPDAEPLPESTVEHGDGEAEDFAGPQTDDGWSDEDEAAANG